MGHSAAYHERAFAVVTTSGGSGTRKLVPCSALFVERVAIPTLQEDSELWTIIAGTFLVDAQDKPCYQTRHQAREGRGVEPVPADRS